MRWTFPRSTRSRTLPCVVTQEPVELPLILRNGMSVSLRDRHEAKVCRNPPTVSQGPRTPTLGSDVRSHKWEPLNEGPPGFGLTQSVASASLGRAEGTTPGNASGLRAY
jgi:hypothetical protein